MAQIDKYSRMQILFSGHMDRFSRMQNLRIHVRKLRFALGYLVSTKCKICVYANFAYTQKWENCGHMDRFAYVSKISVYAKFAYVSKSVHVTSSLEN